MRAMILAAGYGKRMKHLTESTPKPLLKVNDYTLIEYHLFRLAEAGIRDVVINVFYLAEQVQTLLGNGERYGVNIIYSVEPYLLGTGGGVLNALNVLGSEPFLLINSDVWTDFPLSQLTQPMSALAHLVLVENPPQHKQGDFGMADGFVSRQAEPRWTYSGIAQLDPKLFNPCKEEVFTLPSVLDPAMLDRQVTGEIYSGLWKDIGAPERYFEITQTE